MTIHVGNLSPETSLSALRGCFEVFGKVTDVTLSTFTVDGQSQGLGIVEMPSSGHFPAAIVGLQGKELSGSVLELREE